MATVYRVLADPQEYQELRAANVDDEARYRFDGTPLIDIWDPPVVYFPHPTMKEPDFWSCFCKRSIFGITADVAEKIVAFLDQSCELLPLSCELPPLCGANREISLCNVTNVVNCLDSRKSTQVPDIPWWFTEYVFHPDRFEYSLFKIPQTRMTELLCVEGLVARSDEFKGTVERLGLTGLRFQKLWTDEAE